MTLYILALDRSLACAVSFVAPVPSLSDETAAFAPSCRTGRAAASDCSAERLLGVITRSQMQ
jgi:hypothetical protein